MRTFVDNLFYRLLAPHIARWMDRHKREHPIRLPIYIIAGSKKPIRSTGGAIGFDCFVRAVVSPTEKDPNNTNFRKLLFDFKNMPTDPKIAQHIHDIDGQLVYRMQPGETITVGIGFAIAMPFPMFYWVCPRSGLSSVKKVTLMNAPGTVDPDYRGEAGAVVLNDGADVFDIGHLMRIPQCIFQEAIIPELVEVGTLEELPPTIRGSGGFGSTGLYEIGKT